MDEIKAELSARLPSGVAFEIPLFGGIPVPQSTVMTWIIIGVITVLCIWLTHNLKERPGRRQMVAEVLVGFINNFCKENLGKHWRTFAPIWARWRCTWWCPTPAACLASRPPPRI